MMSDRLVFIKRSRDKRESQGIPGRHQFGSKRSLRHVARKKLSTVPRVTPSEVSLFAGGKNPSSSGPAFRRSAMSMYSHGKKRSSSDIFLLNKPSISHNKLRRSQRRIRKNKDSKGSSKSNLSSHESIDDKTIDTVFMKTQLSELEVICIATVTEDAIDLIDILTMPVSVQHKTPTFLMYRTAMERCEGKPLDLPLLAGRIVGEDEETWKRKVESVGLNTVLKRTIDELLHRGSYGILQNACIITTLMLREEKELRDNLNDNLRKIQEVKKNIKETVYNQKEQINYYLKKNNLMKGNLKQMQIFHAREDIYLDKWINARRAQNSYKNYRIVKGKEQQLQVLEDEARGQLYAHRNARLFMMLQIQDLTKQLDHFDRRHEEESMSKENAIRVVQLQIEHARKTIVYARDMCQTMKKKLNFIKNRRESLLGEHRDFKMRENAATKIARWWRRILPILKQKRQQKKDSSKDPKKKGKDIKRKSKGTVQKKKGTIEIKKGATQKNINKGRTEKKMKGTTEK